MMGESANSSSSNSSRLPCNNHTNEESLTLVFNPDGVSLFLDCHDVYFVQFWARVRSGFFLRLDPPPGGGEVGGWVPPDPPTHLGPIFWGPFSGWNFF